MRWDPGDSARTGGDWELVEPTRWRFHLREGVTFHNGNAFNADDVIFSVKRILRAVRPFFPCFQTYTIR